MFPVTVCICKYLLCCNYGNTHTHAGRQTDRQNRVSYGVGTAALPTSLERSKHVKKGYCIARTTWSHAMRGTYPLPLFGSISSRSLVVPIITLFCVLDNRPVCVCVCMLCCTFRLPNPSNLVVPTICYYDRCPCCLTCVCVCFAVRIDSPIPLVLSY